MEQLGIMGGTFNPIHHGHLIAARAALESLSLDRMLLMPNARSPLRLEEELAPAEDRLAMVRAAVAGERTLEACDLEVRREGTSYLVDTLLILKSQYPQSRLHFVMGADSLRTFERWREVDTIVDLALVVVLPRPGGEVQALLNDLEQRSPSLQGKIMLLPEGPRVEISASEVRRRVAAGLSVRYLVPEAVDHYLQEAGLYLG